MKAIIGLGNPGRRYAKTRHNVGFDVVDLLAKDDCWHAFKTCVWHRLSDDIVLVKPLTYMNSSGLAVAQIRRCFQIDLADMLVVVDDVHLDVGRLRLRRHGSHGGHNGLRSIDAVMCASQYPRLRMGVGEPTGSLIDHVLGMFTHTESEVIADAIGLAANGAICWATQGVELAMNQFNAR